MEQSDVVGREYVKRRGPGLVALVLALCGGSILAQDNPFPTASDLAGAQAGDLVVRQGTYQGQKADWCILVVCENSARTQGRTLHLPVLRIHAKNQSGRPPVFYLFGGPGASNIHTWWPEGFYRDHDFVQVGYQGVDGSVKLDLHEVGEVPPAENIMSPDHLRRLGQAIAAGLTRLRREGIDPNCYTMVDVIDDVEAARQRLGYGKINLLSHSYGTQLAHVYCLRYPESVSRNLMVGASAPGFATVWEPADADRVIRAYAELWRKDPACAAQTTDLEKTMRQVLAGLPRQWKTVRIDPDKVRLTTFKMLYDTATAAQAFDAYVGASQGDWGGLALLSVSWDRQPPDGLSVGDSFCKLLGAGIYDPRRDYLHEMAPSDSILGSPVTRLSLGLVQLCPELHAAVRQIPERYQKHQRHGVETLVVNGALDLSSPVEMARKELMPYLQRGKLVVLPNLGHNDPFTAPGSAFEYLMETFYATGEADISKFVDRPVNFIPSRRLTDLARETVP